MVKPLTSVDPELCAMVDVSHHIPYKDWPPLIKKISALQPLQPLSYYEIDSLMRLHEQDIIIDPHEILFHQNSIYEKCIIVNGGWACRFLDHSDGARQIIDYYLPGDIINPFALVMHAANYSVTSISCLNVSIFKPDLLVSLCTVQPTIGLRFLEMLGWQDVRLVRLMTEIGWRTAYQRTAYLLLDLFERLKLVDKTVGNTFFAPVTQQMLADSLGMSIVHMNRTIKKLREDELIIIESNIVKLIDIVRLRQITEYDPFYRKDIRK